VANQNGKCRVEAGWSIHITNSGGPVVETAAGDLRSFLKHKLGIDIPVQKDEDLHLGKCTIAIAAAHTPGLCSCEVSDEQSYCLEIEPEQILVVGGDAPGCLYGVYHLEELFRFAGGDPLSVDRVVKKPLFPLRIGIPSTLDFSDSSLSFLSHLTVNAIYNHYEPYMEQLTPSSLLPQDGVNIVWNQKRIDETNDIFERAQRFGIDGYLYVRGLRPLGISASEVGREMKPFMPDLRDELFAKHPDLKGSNLGVSMFPEGGGFFTNRDPHRRRDIVPCFSSPLYRQFLRETCGNLFVHMPLLKGLVILTTDGTVWCDDSCPACRGTSLVDRWVEYIRLLYDSARSVRKDARFVLYIWGWPWDRRQRDKIINSLPRDIIMLGTYTEGARHSIRGKYYTTIMNLDSSVANSTPGEVFLGDLRAARRHGNPFISLQGFCHNNDFYFIPCTPAPFSYVEQLAHLQRHRVSGWMSLDGSGLNPCVNTDLARWGAWEPAATLGELLRKITINRCGEAAASLVMQAFERLSAAVHDIPTGHYYLGPYLSRSVKYPFPVTKSVTEFIAETSDFGHGTPYFYATVQPKFITKTRGYFSLAQAGFTEGAKLLKKALKKATDERQSSNVLELLQLAEACQIHLESTVNLLDLFYLLRTEPGNVKCQVAILRRELSSSTRYEKLLKEASNPFIGFSPYWGRVYWPEDITKKNDFLRKEIARHRS
jgi:hypothetical protein